MEKRDLYPKLAELKQFPQKQILILDIEWVKSLELTRVKLDVFENTNIVGTIDFEDGVFKVYNVATKEQSELVREDILDFISSL